MRYPLPSILLQICAVLLLSLPCAGRQEAGPEASGDPYAAAPQASKSAGEGVSGAVQLEQVDVKPTKQDAKSLKRRKRDMKTLSRDHRDLARGREYGDSRYKGRESRWKNKHRAKEARRNAKDAYRRAGKPKKVKHASKKR